MTLQKLAALALAGILAVLLAGCAAKRMEFTKLGVSQANKDQDLATCQYEAALATQNVDYSYSTMFGQELDKAFRRSELIQKCLRAKGYRVFYVEE